MLRRNLEIRGAYIGGISVSLDDAPGHDHCFLLLSDHDTQERWQVVEVPRK